MPLPLYKCHKKVRAFKIKEIRFSTPPHFEGPLCRSAGPLCSSAVDRSFSEPRLLAGCGKCERCKWYADPKNAYETGCAHLVATEPGIDPVLVDRAWIAKNEPKPGWYFILYEDGYRSLSPPDVFEAGYTRMDDSDS